jgi:hypothetical protein
MVASIFFDKKKFTCKDNFEFFNYKINMLVLVLLNMIVCFIIGYFAIFLFFIKSGCAI